MPSGTAKGTEAEEGERVQLTARSMGLCTGWDGRGMKNGAEYAPVFEDSSRLGRDQGGFSYKVSKDRYCAARGI